MFADNSGFEYGGIVMTGTTAASAIANYANSASADKSGSRTTETTLNPEANNIYGLTGTAWVSLTDCYINGSNLYFKWHNPDSNPWSLAITVHWRVIK
jgi:hypothetical protein